MSQTKIAALSLSTLLFLTACYLAGSQPSDLTITLGNENLTNYADIPTAWDYHDGDVHYGSDPQIVALDTEDGYTCIRIDGPPSTENAHREVNIYPQTITVSPSTHVIFSADIKTEAQSPSNAASLGGIIGVDLYSGSQRLFEVTKHENHTDPFYYMNNSALNEWDSVYVPYSSDWTRLTLDFIVPSALFTETDEGTPLSPALTVTRCIPWMCMSWNDSAHNTASGYFRNASLQVFSASTLFDKVIAKLEKKNVSFNPWQIGMWAPGMWDETPLRKVLRDLEK